MNPQWLSPDSAAGGGVDFPTEREIYSASAPLLLYP